VTGRELSVLLGRPDPSHLYDVIAEMVKAGLIETDPRSCRYYLAGSKR